MSDAAAYIRRAINELDREQLRLEGKREGLYLALNAIDREKRTEETGARS